MSASASSRFLSHSAIAVANCASMRARDSGVSAGEKSLRPSREVASELWVWPAGPAASAAAARLATSIDTGSKRWGMGGSYRLEATSAKVEIMGDSGEGLIDADARIQELADEREAARRER